MVIKTINNFNLKQIAESGQCFRMFRLTDFKYYVIAFGNYLEIEQHKNQFIFFCEQEEFDSIWVSYFDLLADYQAYIDLVDLNDSFLYQCIKYGNGIRILRQDLWETLISFIISQNNNIPRIQKSISLLCSSFGEKKRNIFGTAYYTFPSIEKLASLSLKEVKHLNLGYRDIYILEIAKKISSNLLNLEELKQLSYLEAYQILLNQKGIGKKVANCICLFGLHCIDAFPIDTHIKSILEKYYPNGFPLEKYNNCAGIIQQYMFYYKRNHKE